MDFGSDAKIPNEVPTTPHLSPPHGEEIRFALLPFRSLLLRESHLVSFPVGTEMFHFPTSRLLMEDGISQEVLFGNPGF